MLLMSILKTTILLQVFIANKELIINKIFVANKIFNVNEVGDIESNNKSIEKFIELKTKKLFKF